jgi:uncharacterized membrane protein YoaK (UPF0700 family)
VPKPSASALPPPEPPPRYLDYILGLTGFAAGAVDIISFARLGGVFASAMTGNLAFLGLYLARFSFASAIGSAIALLGFIAGAACGHLLTRGKDRKGSLQILLGAEVVLLALLVLLWPAGHHPNGSARADALITFLSVAMGFQSIAGKKINLSNIPTIVFTSTLINLVIGIADAIVNKKPELAEDTKRQLGSFLLYFAGALCAGFLVFLDDMFVAALPFLAVGAAMVIQLRHRHE